MRHIFIKFFIKQPRGFFALLSVVLLSAALLAAASATAAAGWYARANALDAELKARSLAAAEACLNRALIRVATDASYAGGDTYTLNSLDHCQVVSVNGVGQKTIIIQGTSNTATTDESVVLSPDLTIVSRHELR